MKDLFLCHTGADKEWVENLATRLEGEAIEGTRINVWFDKWDIDGGENILARIEAGLRESRFVAVVLSPAMTRADWPTLEWQTQVFDDPAGLKRGRILPLLRHVFDPITGEPIEIPLPLKILKRYDFSDERRFEGEFSALVRRLRGERPLRGSGAPPTNSAPAVGHGDPEEVTESLISNLLPVTQLPGYIYSDEATETQPSAIIERIRPKVPWLLSGGRIYSFCDPQARRNPFAKVQTGRLRRVEATAEWLSSDQKAALVVRLLNDGLRRKCRSLHIWLMPESKEQFYFAIPRKTPRTFAWGGSGRARTLAKMVAGANGEAFGVHHAAKLRFMILGGRAFLLLQPGWTFTTDGVNPLPGRQLGVLSMRWGGRERNAAVLRNTLMWSLVLSSGATEITMDVGSGVIRVVAVPAHSSISVGLTTDSIQLERILGGDGAGETAPDASAADELDGIARLRDFTPSGTVWEPLSDEQDDDEV